MSSSNIAFQKLLDGQFLQFTLVLCDKFMVTYALALKLPTKCLETLTCKAIWVPTIAHYSALPLGLDARFMNSCDHTDKSGTATLAQQDEICGFQVQITQVHWIDAKSISDILLGSIGDLLERRSNSHLKGAMHRVMLKPGHEHCSLAAFHISGYHTKTTFCLSYELPKDSIITSAAVDFRRQRESSFHMVLDV